MKIFAPNDFFRDELTSSWCENIKTTVSKDHIPVECDTHNKNPILVAEPNYRFMKRDSIDHSKHFAIAIPLQKNWHPVDLSSGFDNLVVCFNISFSHFDCCHCEISFDSLTDNVEAQSNSVDLTCLQSTVDWQKCHIPMIAFRVGRKDFNLTTVRLFKLLCVGYSKVKLSNIRIEKYNFGECIYESK